MDRVSRTCPVCRREMRRRPGEKDSHFRQRITCGAAKCGAEQRRASTAETLAKREAERVAQHHAMLPAADPQQPPRGATTVAEFLKRGGRIIQCPPRTAHGAIPTDILLDTLLT
jgi:hypothetical protein